MKEVLEHDMLKDTEEALPTSILTELVQTYYTWLYQGGQRISLFMPGGAVAVSEDADQNISDEDEWNFGITQDFEKRFSSVLEIPDFSIESPKQALEGEETPRGASRQGGLSPPMTLAQKANFEARVKRGADLSNLFDEAGPAYEYKTKTDFVPMPEQQRRTSDLPFRAMAEDRPSSIASNVIDLGDFDEADYAVAAAPRTDDKIQTTYAASTVKGETIRLADASTLRDKRANSKGPRDPQNQSLTARRMSSAEEIPHTTAAHDFATSQDGWTQKSKSKVPGLQEPAEITSSRGDRATMDWSFASAMSEAVIPQISEPEPSSTEKSSPPESLEQRAKKHATMDWSFSSAMAEVDTSQAAEPVIGSSPPRQHTLQPSRPTPTRPAPLMRQMTMPVTYDDFAHVEEQDIPRPSTAMSEAYSDISASSTDVDPFGLERDGDDHPGPATLEEDVGNGMSSFYSSRGRTLVGAEEYTNSSAGGTPVTASGSGPFSLGRPVRIGENGFPGQSAASSAINRAGRSGVPPPMVASSSSSGNRPIVQVPHASPPSALAMSATASPMDIETELMSLLEGLQGTLNVARDVVGGMERTRRRDTSDEWEDEE
jgi:hypothetical protein